MEKESLKFEIKLSGTHWGKQPQFSVWLDDEKITQGTVDVSEYEIQFDRTIDEGNHVLKIRLDNKTTQDTVIDGDQIVKDMLLNIDDIIIDDISVGNLRWSATYLLDEPQLFQGKTINHLDHCVNLGWNGAYVFKFSSPFYMWLLEKL